VIHDDPLEVASEKQSTDSDSCAKPSGERNLVLLFGIQDCVVPVVWEFVVIHYAAPEIERIRASCSGVAKHIDIGCLAM